MTAQNEVIDLILLYMQVGKDGIYYYFRSIYFSPKLHPIAYNANLIQRCSYRKSSCLFPCPYCCICHYRCIFSLMNKFSDIISCNAVMCCV